MADTLEKKKTSGEIYAMSLLGKYRGKIIDSKEKVDVRETFDLELKDLNDGMTMWAQTEKVVENNFQNFSVHLRPQWGIQKEG